VIAEVQNGVWTGQEPDFESPFNLGAHCAKGAAVREHANGERRLKYPMKKEGGEWKRISWDQAINEIGDGMMSIREQSGPDSVYWLGSAKFSNEQAYLFRKFAAYWGTNNVDHQARICHSTTVAGVANTWGYGAMTNSYNDIHNSRAIFLIGGNPAEAHPVSLLHVLKAKEQNNAPLIVCDPRFTRTAAHADEYVRFRPGTDVALIWGILWHIFENGWEDKEFIRTRVWGMDQIREEVAKWTPEEVERVTGTPGSQLRRVARTMANNRPGTVIWCMGGTQHTNGNNNTRAYCVLQLALGNMGTTGGGTNIFRGHDNVQGATDLGVLSNTLPGYYGLGAGAWNHWANVWGADAEELKSRFANEKMMQKVGFTVARWYEGVLLDAEELGQDGNVHAAFYWGHSTNCQSQLDRIKRALEKVDLLVDIDPFVTTTSILPDRPDGVYILPAATVYEQYGSVTNSNRDIQWRNRVVAPVWESRSDLAILLDLAERLGFKDGLTRNAQAAWQGVPESMADVKELPEETYASIIREWNLGMRTIGMTGQTYERIKRQQEWAHAFDVKTKKAVGGPVDGEQWGLPWPCWTEQHPGTHILYRTDIPVSQGGLGFRARWGTQAPDGDTLLAATGSAPADSSINGGYAELKDWKTDLTGQVFADAMAKELAPFGNGRARFNSWNIPDPVPAHREPIHSPRPDLVEQWPTYDDVKDHYRVPTLYKSLQKPDWVKDYPIILSSGRQVEFEGGGNSERACWWLVELQPEMYVEIHPRLANDHRIKHGDWVWIESPEDQDSKPSRIKVKAKLTKRVNPDMIYLPFHWGGMLEGESLASKYPAGYVPYGLGESANIVTNYGYDRVTQMQETKTGLCRISKA
jgi:formate dehydrogenase major subunit